MATPVSGTITADQLRSEITRGAGALSMDEIRIRFGASGSAISFNQLYACEGYIATCGSFNSKFTSYTGWEAGVTGSVSPSESNNRVQVVTNCFISTTFSSFGADVAKIKISANNSGSFNGDAVATGWKATDVIKVIVSNTTYPVNTDPSSTVSNSSISLVTAVGPTLPSSGNVHCLIQF